MKSVLSKRSVIRALRGLKASLREKRIQSPRAWNNFIFICGAAGNSSDSISFRRQAVKKFIENHISSSKVLIAERVLDVLTKEGHFGNQLDIESDLSIFADYIVIILESSSAFCELGAFSVSKDLRKKIIVINDIIHEKKSSFINNGPIRALIETKAGPNKVLHYKMSTSPLLTGPDGIGSIFSALFIQLTSDKKATARRPPLTSKNLSPAGPLSKDKLMFINDLIFFASPVHYRDLVEIVKFLFGKDGAYDHLKTYLSLLAATDDIIRDPDTQLYRTMKTNTLFNYSDSQKAMLQAAFKVAYFKFLPERMQWQLNP